MLLDRRIAHIKKMETHKRQKFGQEVNLIIKSDPVGCTHCGYDKMLNTSTNPNCSYCKGKYWIYTEIVYNELVCIKWITELEIYSGEAGELKIGDALLNARIESLDYFKNIMNYKTRIEVDPYGTSTTPIADSSLLMVVGVSPTTLRTEVKVHAKRVTSNK